jgi:hypothetical protein
MITMVCQYGVYGHIAAGALVSLLGIDTMMPTAVPLWASSAGAAYLSDSYCRGGMKYDQQALYAAGAGVLGGMAFRRVVAPAVLG